MTYTQLTETQRYQIYALNKAKMTQTEIAQIIGVHKSTVSREIHRNSGLRGYRPKQAHSFAIQRKLHKAKQRITTQTWETINTLIKQEWSPEQISGWLKSEKHMSVSPEWIYQYIYTDKRYGGQLYQHLRCQKQRKKRYGSNSRRGTIPNQISIDQRPAIVEKRQRIGDWELDTVIGKNHKQALVTLVERKSRFTLIAKVIRKTAENVSDAIIKLLFPYPNKVKTLTADNGREFAQHETIAQQLKVRFFFAHPYASWERGLNENTNGLIRQYFPKKTDFTTITNEHIQFVIERLNNRPRKCLGFKTPNQIFAGLKPEVALAT